MTIKTPIILAIVIAGVVGYREMKSGQVLSSKTVQVQVQETETPRPLPEATEGAATPTPKPKPTLTPTPTPVPQPKFSAAQIYEFTNRFGGQYGVDPNVLRHIALCESGFRSEARNYVYAGLYQFDTRTWKVYRQKMGEDPDPDLRYNAEEAVQTAAYALSLGQLRLWPNCKP